MRDPVQYARYSDERSRPFFTLLSRVPDRPYREIVDLGCGTGVLTQAISERWPEAHTVGLDNSPQMLASSKGYAVPGRLEFAEADVAAYATSVDLLFSNATLQWLDGHEALFPRLAALVNAGGVFAHQMPHSYDLPSHLIMTELANNGPWAAKLRNWRQIGVMPLRWYVDLLMDLGFEVEAWETEYYFVLQGEDPVLEWVKGTSLQPILSRLDEAERGEFTSTYAAALRQAYPASSNGSTIYPFKRIFFVACLPE
jgi:trans-aconitate 2-methyltransferase